MAEQYGRTSILKFHDGDSAELKPGTITDGRENSTTRIAGYDAPETHKPDKITGSDLAEPSRQGAERIIERGGSLEDTGQVAGYNRPKLILRNKEGEDMSKEMLQAGLGAPTGFGDTRAQEQAYYAGIAREALGYKRTSDPDLAQAAQDGNEIRQRRDWRPFSEHPNSTVKFDYQDNRSTFSRSWDRGVAGAKASAGGFMRYLGREFGSSSMQRMGEDITREAQFDGNVSSREIEKWDDIKSFDDGVTYLIETAGESAPEILADAAMTVASGGAGAGVALLRRAGAEGIKKAVKNGALTGAAAYGFSQATGDMYNTLEQAGAEDPTNGALTAGIAGAALNVAPVAKLLPRFAKSAGLSDEVTTGLQSRLKDIGKTTMLGAGLEGATGVAQGVVNEFIKNQALDNDKWDYDSVQAVDDMLRSVIGGGVGAGAGSAGSNAFGMMREYQAARDAADADGSRKNEDGWLVGEDGQELTEEVTQYQYNNQELDGKTKDLMDWAVRKAAEGTQDSEQELSKAGLITREVEYWANNPDYKKPKEGETPQPRKIKKTRRVIDSAKIPPLPAARFMEIDELVNPDNKPITLAQLNDHIESGRLEEDEVTRYLGSPLLGESHSVVSNFDKEKNKALKVAAIDSLVNAVQNRDVGLTDSQVQQVAEARRTLEVDKVDTVLKDVAPALGAVVKNSSEIADLKSSWRSFEDSRRPKTTEADSYKEKQESVQAQGVKKSEQTQDDEQAKSTDSPAAEKKRKVLSLNKRKNQAAIDKNNAAKADRDEAKARADQRGKAQERAAKENGGKKVLSLNKTNQKAQQTKEKDDQKKAEIQAEYQERSKVIAQRTAKLKESASAPGQPQAVKDLETVGAAKDWDSMKDIAKQYGVESPRRDQGNFGVAAKRVELAEKILDKTGVLTGAEERRGEVVAARTELLDKSLEKQSRHQARNSRPRRQASTELRLIREAKDWNDLAGIARKYGLKKPRTDTMSINSVKTRLSERVLDGVDAVSPTEVEMRDKTRDLRQSERTLNEQKRAAKPDRPASLEERVINEITALRDESFGQDREQFDEVLNAYEQIKDDPAQKDLLKKLIDYARDLTVEDAAFSNGERVEAASTSEDTGDERTVGDIQAEFSESGYSSLLDSDLTPREREMNATGFSAQYMDLVSQLVRNLGFTKEELKGLNRFVAGVYLAEPQTLDQAFEGQKSKTPAELGKEMLNRAIEGRNSGIQHPSDIVPAGSERVEAEIGGGSMRPARIIKEQSVDSLKNKLEKEDYIGVVEHLTELGLFAPGHVIGRMPKVPRSVRVDQMARSTQFMLNSGKIKREQTIQTSKGPILIEKLVEDAIMENQGAVHALGTVEAFADGSSVGGNAGALDDSTTGPTDSESARQAYLNGLMDAVSELASFGYHVDFSDLPAKTVIRSGKGKEISQLTLGKLRRYKTNRSEFMEAKDREGTTERRGKFEKMDGEVDEGRRYTVWDDLADGYIEMEDLEDDPTIEAKYDVAPEDVLGDKDAEQETVTSAGEFKVTPEGETPKAEIRNTPEETLLAAKRAHATRQMKQEAEMRKERLTANKTIVRVARRKRGRAEKSMFDVVRSVNTRLKRIHPELAEKIQKHLLDKQVYSERLIADMEKMVGGADKVQKGYQDALDGRDTSEAAAYKKYVAHIDSFVAKYDKNHRSKKGPLINLDLDAVDKNRAAFVELLDKNGVKNPHEFVERIFEGKGRPEWAHTGRLNNATRSKLELLRPMLKELKDGGFLDTDAPRHLTHYAHAAASWASWKETVADDYDRIMDEVNPGNKQEALKLMNGVTGKLGADTPPWVRRFNSVAMGFQSATVLWFSAVASIPEFAGVVARERGSIDGLGKDARKVLTRAGRNQMRDFAKDYSIVTGEVVEHALQQLYAMNDVTTGRVSQRISNTVFKYNGQQWLTELNRVVAASSGRRFLEHHAKNDSARSRRMLAELGIDQDTVKQHLKDGRMDSKSGQAYRDALHRFVNQSVTNPRADQTPLIASDPRFAIVTSLKKFFYGFYHNVHKSLYNEVRVSKSEGMTRQALKAVAMTGLTILPMAALSELLRDFIKYPFGYGRIGKPKELSEWVTGTLSATGGLGPLQAAAQASEMSQYGMNPLIAFAGPTASWTKDLLTGDMTLARNVPIANQLPLLRQPVNEFGKGVKEFVTGDDY